MLKNRLTQPTLPITIILIMFSIWSTNILAHDGAKIAVVDLDYLVANSPEGKSLQAKLEQFQQTIKAEVESKQNEMRQLRQRITDQANSLSNEQLNELQKQFEDLQVSLRRLMDDKQREGQKMQSEGLKQIEINLEPVFTQFKNDNNYDLILNRVPGVVVMASDKVDVTDKLIELLNNRQ